MKIKLIYYAQVRRAAAMESETVTAADGIGLAEAVRQAAERHGEAFRTLVLDDAGSIRPVVLVLLNGVPATRGESRALRDGDEISMLSAVAGG